MKELLDACCVPSIVDSLYLERDAYESDVASLRLTLEASIECIKAKIKKSSASVTLNKTALMFDAIAKYIEVANGKMGAHNNMLGNLAAEKKRLISQIWKKLLENTKPAYTQFKSQCGDLNKDIIYKMRTGPSQIKQVFVLTHNIYFHKEVTFDTTRIEEMAKADETFWVIRKSSARSELRSFKENPIKSSYELLWQEVKQNPPSDTAIQNAMRRILEHYFKYYGDKKPKDIINNFDGKDKIICNTMLSWINDGSHFATDDLYVACDSVQVNRYRSVFRKIFEDSDHGGHYRMMMCDDYVVHLIAANDDGAKATDVAEAVKQ